MQDSDPFADAASLPDELINVLDLAQSDEEVHFVRVINFHGDILNGGLDQALFNHKLEISDVIQSYRELSMHPIATLLVTARKQVTISRFWRGLFSRPESDFDSLYLAMTYNLPYACNDLQDDAEFPETGIENDWVDRLALKYARRNRIYFSALQAAYDRERADKS